MDRPIEIEEVSSVAPDVPIMGTMTANPLEVIYGPRIGFTIGEFLYYHDHLAQVSSIGAGTIDLVGFGTVPCAACSVLKSLIIDHFPRTIEIYPPHDRCMVSPEVIITDREHKIRCPKCFTITRGKTYAEAFDKWYEHCK